MRFAVRGFRPARSREERKRALTMNREVSAAAAAASASEAGGGEPEVVAVVSAVEVEPDENGGEGEGECEGDGDGDLAASFGLSRHECDEHIIEAVRSLPCLYDASCKEYRDAGRTSRAWEEAAERCPGLDRRGVKERWRKLRDAYVKVNKKLGGGGGGAGEEYQQLRTKWPYYDQMSFLADFIKHRKTPHKRHSFDIGSGTKKPVRVEYRVEAGPIQVLEGQESGPNATPKRLVWSANAGGASRSKRLRGPDTLELALLESLGQAAPKAAEAGAAAATLVNDEEALFGKMVAATLRRFPARAKALCKFRIQEIIFEQENQNLSDPSP